MKIGKSRGMRMVEKARALVVGEPVRGPDLPRPNGLYWLFDPKEPEADTIGRYEDGRWHLFSVGEGFLDEELAECGIRISEDMVAKPAPKRPVPIEQFRDTILAEAASHLAYLDELRDVERKAMLAEAITQGDRDTAATFLMMVGKITDKDADRIRQGLWDETRDVRFFAQLRAQTASQALAVRPSEDEA